MKLKILVITPIEHLKQTFELMKTFDYIYKPYLNKKELIEILKNDKNINALFTNPNKQGFILDKEVFINSNIKIINTASTGTNHINKVYCENNNIKIYSLTKDYDLINQLTSTSELAFGLMISLLRKIPFSFDSVKNYEWNYEKYIGRQIKDFNLGVIGYGRLGKMMVHYGLAFGMNVYVYDPYQKVEIENVNQVNLNELLNNSDVVSLHVHVTDETRKMINKDFIEKMKNNSYLINTSRGELVDELEILKNLENGKLAGYGTDVISDEFNDIRQSKLIEYSKNEKYNIVITPHIGGMTYEGQNKAFYHAMNKFN
jgi:D-3-phosphoglycerate dehydrogenase / 2-oxoglutarate reductase